MATRLLLPEAIDRNLPLLLDTNVLIREFNARTLDLIRFIPVRNRKTSIVSLFEFLRGTAGAILAHELRRDRRAWLDEFSIERARISTNASLTFESLVESDGAPPTVEDCLIAAD